MNENDSVRLYVGVFNFGVVLLLAMVGWFLSSDNELDWPGLKPRSAKIDAESQDAGTGSGATSTVDSSGEQEDDDDPTKPVLFLAFIGILWARWAISLDRIRGKAFDSTDKKSDYLSDIGIHRVNWLIAVIAVGIGWYVVFDDDPMGMPALVVLASLLFLSGIQIGLERIRIRVRAK